LRISRIGKLLVASGAALALAGCGSSSNASGATFVSQANRICAEANSKLASLPAINTTADLLETGPREISVTNSALAKLRALTPPAAKKATADELISGLTQETALIQQIVAAVRAGNLKHAQSLATQGTSLNASDHAKATTLGMTECTKSVSPASTSATSTGPG
jgi:hypothetical protein